VNEATGWLESAAHRDAEPHWRQAFLLEHGADPNLANKGWTATCDG
jgi:hypothetical protein